MLAPACSTGEEVYSLAFVLGPKARRLGRRLEIVGTDVRSRAVRQAREGVYGIWSLRNTPPAERPKYFEVPREGRFRVKDEFRPVVRFAVRNLLDAIDDGPYDAVVLCNATLYMHESAARSAYANVAACLQPEGLLLIAPTDPPPGATLPPLPRVRRLERLPKDRGRRGAASGARNLAPRRAGAAHVLAA